VERVKIKEQCATKAHRPLKMTLSHHLLPLSLLSSVAPCKTARHLWAFLFFFPSPPPFCFEAVAFRVCIRSGRVRVRVLGFVRYWRRSADRS
jgi:hypothetical protein